MKINLKLLPIKAHYFLFNAGTAPFVPFIPTLISQLGFSSVVVGTIYTILPITAVLGKPIAGAIADRFQCQKLMFLLFIVSTLIAYYAVPWVPSLEHKGTTELHCSKQSFIKIYGSDKVTDTCLSDSLAQNNKTVTCKLSCEADETMLLSICKDWGQKQFCSHTIPGGEALLHIVSGQMSQSVNGDSLSLKSKPLVHNVVTSSPQTVNFSAHIRPSHSVPSDGSLFIPLYTASVVPPDWFGATCSNLVKTNCSIWCDDPTINDLTSDSTVIDSNVVSLYQFWLLLLCLVCGWISMSVVVSVGDAICFELLEDQPSKYGEQRLWGSIGWGIFSFLAGYLVDVFSSGLPNKDYSPALYLMVVLLGLDVLVSSQLNYQQSRRSPSILQDIGTILTDLRLIIFLVWCIIVGLFTAFVWNFLLLYLEELAKIHGGCASQTWIKTLEGLVMAIQCFGGELPFFFLSGWILKKLGHINCMSLVLFSLGVRFLLYSLLTDPWYSLPIELMNGLTFGLFYATMTTYASVIAPPGTETTVQGLVGAVFEGVGVSIGSFIGGWMFKVFSGSTVFRIFGLFGIGMSIVHLIVQYFVTKYYSPHTRENKDFQCAKYASPNDAIHILEDRSPGLST